MGAVDDLDHDRQVFGQLEQMRVVDARVIAPPRVTAGEFAIIAAGEPRL